MPNVDANWSVLGQDGIGAFAVALVSGAGSLGGIGRKAKMVIHLSAQRD